jgi:hypothetical protein
MLIVIPYPNNEQYVEVADAEEDCDTIHVYRKNILDYVDRVCTGPWESDDLDVLLNGIRVRLGCEKDFFMLQLKYGTAKEY